MRVLNLGKLSPVRKRQAWSFIQTHRPALAEFYETEEYKRLRDVLGCKPIIRVTEDEFKHIQGVKV